MSIPDANGVIHGARNNVTGNLRVFDNSTQSPHPLETELDWNQVGPQGPIGPQGPVGSQGPQGPVGPQGEAGQNGAPSQVLTLLDATVSSTDSSYSSTIDLGSIVVGLSVEYTGIVKKYDPEFDPGHPELQLQVDIQIQTSLDGETWSLVNPILLNTTALNSANQRLLDIMGTNSTQNISISGELSPSFRYLKFKANKATGASATHALINIRYL